MSRGLWTKCYSLDGSQTYFFNAAKNVSLWTPPPDSIIHEAINLKPQDSIVVESNSESATRNRANSVASVDEAIEKNVPNSSVNPIISYNSEVSVMTTANLSSAQKFLEETLYVVKFVLSSD